MNANLTLSKTTATSTSAWTGTAHEHVLDTHVVGTGSALRSAVICFYLSNEGVSLLENASHLGLPVPEKLKEVLSQLHNKHEKE